MSVVDYFVVMIFVLYMGSVFSEDGVKLFIYESSVILLFLGLFFVVMCEFCVMFFLFFDVYGFLDF